MKPIRAQNHWNFFDAQLVRALDAQMPSTTSPSLRASTGILNPNSRMLLHVQSTTASFFRGFAGVLDQAVDGPKFGLLFGLLILFSPGTGALAIVLWIGAYALVFGVIL